MILYHRCCMLSTTAGVFMHVTTAWLWHPPTFLVLRLPPFRRYRNPHHPHPPPIHRTHNVLHPYSLALHRSPPNPLIPLLTCPPFNSLLRAVALRLPNAFHPTRRSRRCSLHRRLRCRAH